MERLGCNHYENIGPRTKDDYRLSSRTSSLDWQGVDIDPDLKSHSKTPSQELTQLTAEAKLLWSIFAPRMNQPRVAEAVRPIGW